MANSIAAGRSVGVARQRRRRQAWWLVSAAGVVAVGLLAVHAVDNQVTVEDREYIEQFLAGAGIGAPAAGRDYLEEIAFIEAVQRAVLSRAAGREGIPFRAGREPKDVLEAGTGECYDRSRVIEKILRDAGFRTRHVAIYSTRETGSALKSLLTPGVSSHAVTEVLTRRGWLVVDSNRAWLSLDRDGNPWSMEAMRADVAERAIAWAEQPEPMTSIFDEPFVHVYGLYSRHGLFYPPYNPIPDVHYGELTANLSQHL